MISIMPDLQVLLADLPLILFFFLPMSLIMGGFAAFYAFILSRIKNRFISYSIPFAIVLAWILWAAAQEIPGPWATVVNLGYMFLTYPLIVASLLPLANYIIKLENSWILALVAGTMVMLFSLTRGGLGGDQIVTVPAVPPGYFDNLIKVFVSWLTTSVYVIAGYAILAIIKTIRAGWIKGQRDKKY
jgi:hypothetical protein